MSGIITTRYVRKPLFVDAVKITPDNFAHISSWCQGEIRSLEDDAQIKNYDELNPAEAFYIRVRVHNPKNVRQTQARVGDWLLYTDRGYKVYTEKAFFNSFEVAPGEDQGHKVVAGPNVIGDPADVGEVQA